MTEEPLVRMDVTSGTATIVLDNPSKRNALSRRLLVELRDALQASRHDDSIRCIVLTGAGPVFCAGADLKEQQDGLGPGPVSLTDIFDLITTHPCPVVARVNGPARAGGLGLLAACDITIGMTGATFGFSEVRIGVVPAVISVPVMERMSAVAAREYFLTGENFDGVTAQQVGLLNRAVAPEELDTTVQHYVDMLVLGGPTALAETKGLFARDRKAVAQRYDQLLELSIRMFESAEGQEGISAFREKRPAAWVPA